MKEFEEHLDKTRKRLIDSVLYLTQENMDYIPSYGGWSIGEVLQHLNFTEARVLKMFNRLLTGELKSEKKLFDRIRKIPPSWIAYRWKKIKTFKSLNPIGSKLKEEIFTNLEKSREGLKKFLFEHKEDNFERLTYPHIVLGELNIYEWVYFIGYHEERHRKQIEDVKRDFRLKIGRF